MSPLAVRLRRHLTAAAVLVVASLLATSSASAQFGGGRGAGGGGGRGGPGGGGRGGPPGEARAASEANSAAKQIEQLASLKPALKHVDHLSRAQKDSLDRIESSYKRNLKEYGAAVKKLLAAEGRPDFEQVRKLRTDAHQQRDEEWQAARAVLSSDEQRTKFDANVAALRAEDAQRTRPDRGSRG